MLEQITAFFDDSIALKQQSKTLLSDPIHQAAKLMQKTLMADKKILTCGNGGSAGDAMHLSSELLNRFERERKPLAAIALTTDSATLTSIANDYDFSHIFSKQITALGQPDDLLICYTTSGNSANILKAIDAAHHKDMRVLLITGITGGQAKELLRSNDLAIAVPSTKTARIQEVHLLITHCLCAYLDQVFSDE